MKQWMKITLIVGVVLCFLGVICCGLGALFGESFQDALHDHSLNISLGRDKSQDGSAIQIDENGDLLARIITVETGDINALEIDWAAGNIQIDTWDAAEIQITEDAGGSISAADTLDWRISGDTLKILYEKRGNIISSTISKDLTILLPADLAQNLKKLTIHAASADVLIPCKLQVKNLVMDCASGNLTAEELTVAEKLDFNSVSGELNIIGKVGKLDVEGVSGNVSATLLALPEEVEFDVMSADLRLMLHKSSDFSVDLDSVSGEIYIGGEAQGSRVKPLFDEVRCVIEAKTVSGCVYIDFI